MIFIIFEDQCLLFHPVTVANMYMHFIAYKFHYQCITAIGSGRQYLIDQLINKYA